MNREWLILFLVVIIVFLSGCGILDESQEGNYTPEEKDEALKFDYEIAGQVLPGQAINMKVYLANQVKDDVGNITLQITDPYGLTLLNQICPGGTGLTKDNARCGFVADLCGCTFSSIPSFEEKEIILVFKVPDMGEIAKIGRELEPEFTITYNYHGEKKYRIPILRSDEKSTTAEIVEPQTKGPIHVEIERGFTSFKDDWEKDKSQFSILIRVKDVLTSKPNVEIDNEKFQIYLTNLIRIPSIDTEPILCEFSEKEIDSDGNTYYTPTSNIILPMKKPIICGLEAQNTLAPWIYGEVRVYYEYIYKTVKIERIDVETVIA